MGRMIRGFAVAVAVMSLITCGGGSSDTAPTSSGSIVTDTLTGTVPPPINGVLQVGVSFFNVGQSGGTVTIVLTSAIEKFPDGTFLTTVPMGLTAGTPSGSGCTISATNPPAIVSAGPNSGIAASLTAGAYCVQVSDVTNQVGPVSYTVVVQHP
jgi:hypothetical protein